MIMGFEFLDIAHAGVLPQKRTLLLEEADKLSWLSTIMEPQTSLCKPAERDVLAQAVRGVQAKPSTAYIQDEYGLSMRAVHMALGRGLSSPQVEVLGSAALRKGTGIWTKEDTR